MDKVIINLSLFLVILGTGLCQNMAEGDPCSTKSYNGTCVLVTDCPSAISLLQLRDYSRLGNIICGFFGRIPLVCCPVPSDNNSIFFINKTEEVATSRPKKTTTMKPEETTLQPSTPSDPFPSRKVCGQVRNDDRIYGGTIAEMDEFPWLARIGYIHDTKKVFACTASLITDRYVITAAHCVSKNISGISVRLGEWDEQTEKDCVENKCNDRPIDLSINKIILHPNYNKMEKSKYDIALLQLSEPVVFTDFIQPICLPTTEYVEMQDYVRDSSYWTAGWGITEYGETSPIKRKIKLEAVPTEICEKISTSVPKSSFPNLICAGGRKGKDSCRGDSGGPLAREVAENYQNNWYLFGITSFGTNHCGSEGIPGFYTRVTSYMDWIRSVIDS